MKRKLLAVACLMGFTNFINTTGPQQPTLARVYADPFVPAVEQSNSPGAVGTLNSSFGTNGSLNLSTQLAGSSASAVRTLADGSVFVLLDNGIDSVVAKYTATGVLDTMFNSPDGFQTLSGLTSAYFMELDSAGNILVGGDNDDGGSSPLTNGWMVRIAPAGNLDTQFNSNFAAAGTWDFPGAFAQQTSGRYIIAGRSPLYTQLVAFNIDGTVDTTFGNNGYVIFDGTGSAPEGQTFPISAYGVMDIAIASDDSIFVGYRNDNSTQVALAKFDANGLLVRNLLNALGGTIKEIQIRVGLTSAGDIIVAGTLIDYTIGIISWPVDLSASLFTCIIPLSGTNQVQIADLVTLSNGYFAVLSSDLTNNSMRVDQFQFNGSIDTNFNANGTAGYIEFNPGYPDGQTIVSALLYRGAVSQDGQLYLSGVQTTSDGSGSTVSPYLSKLYDYQYASQVPQYPATNEQGQFDTTFGIEENQSVAGVEFLYNGNFGQMMQQKARAIIQQIDGGALLIGGDGLTGLSPANRTMMLTQLNAYGNYDVGFGTNGKLLLPNETTSNENLVSLIQGSSTDLYVAGTSDDDGAFLRSYYGATPAGAPAAGAPPAHFAGDTIWNATPEGSNTSAVGLALQRTPRALLFVADSGSGHISAYQITGVIAGQIDATFNVSSDHQGYIQTADFSLNMGPVYGGGVVNDAGNIFIAYASTVSPYYINVAAIKADGSGLVTPFANDHTVDGIFDNVFGTFDVGGMTATNVRIALTDDQNIMVTAVNVANNECLITVLDGVTGNRDLNFNGGAVLSVHVDPNNDISLSSLTCLSDGSAMITGFDNSSKQMFTFRITHDGALDETFNPQGIQLGVLIFTVTDQGADYDARCLTGLTIQSIGDYAGDIVLTAYEQQTATQSTPEVMRVFGQPGTTQVARFPNVDQYQGTLDVGLNGNGAITLNGTPYTTGQETIDISAGMGKVVFTYPLDNVHEGKLLVGIDSGETSLLARVYATNMTLDDTFGAGGIRTLATGLLGIDCISIDANNKILIGGANLSSTLHQIWAQQVSDDGTSAISFEIPSIIIGINQIYQQKSGRYIVACRDSSNRGYLLAYQNQLVDANTMLQLDQTFNPLGTIPGNPSSTLQPGYFVFEPTTGGLFNLVINNDDTILVAYFGTTIKIAKIYADGSGLVDGSGFAGFGTDGVVSTGITPDAASVIRLVITAQGRIVVAASCGSGTNVQVARYTALGVVDGSITTITGIGSAGVTLTDLIETTTGQTILTGFNTSGANGQLFAVRLTSVGILDTNWNPYPTSTDVAGILTSNVDGVTNVYDAAIGINGDVYVIGGKVVDMETPIVPLLMRIIGANYIPAVAQAPLAAPAGTLDYTINQPEPLLGALNIGYSTGVDPNKLYIYPNGSMLIASNENGIPSYVSKLDATLAIDTDFGNSTSYLQFDSISYINDMFVSDATGQPGFMYITGNDASGNMISAKILPDGSDYTTLATLVNWQAGKVIREMMTGDILVAGNNGTVGALALYTSNCLGLNPLFGNQTPQNGIYLTDSSHPIVAMTIDEYDRIYIAYLNNNEQDLIIQRLLANGSGVDPYFGTVSINTGTNSHFHIIVSLSLDNKNNQLVVGAEHHNFNNNIVSYNIYRRSTIDGSATGTAVINVNDYFFNNITTLFIDSDQNIYVVGRSYNGTKSLIARIKSVDRNQIALDDTYATNGIAYLQVGPLTRCQSGALDPDGRVYVVGVNNGGTVPYIARIFGDNYYTQVSQALDAVVPGDFDYTYGYDGVAQTYANGASSSTANQQVKAISQFPAGTNIMSVVGDGIKSWTVQLLADGTNDPAYGSGEGIEITKLAGDETVNGMIFDGVGNMIVFGSNDVSGGYVKSVLPTGHMNPTFGGFTGNSTTVLHPFGTAYGLMTTVNAVAQLNNGRLVVVGNNNGVGTVMMLSPTGVPLPEFGTNGSVISGLDITSVSVDADNNLYLCVGYLYDDSVISVNAIRFLKLNASGIELLNVEHLLDDVGDYQTSRLVFDLSGNIIIAVSGFNETGQMFVMKINPDGTSYFDEPSIINFGIGLNIIVTSLSVLESGKILVAGYQYDSNDATNNYQLVVCLTPAGELDTTFNPEGAVPGILKFQTNPLDEAVRVLWNMTVQSDGQILLAGSQALLLRDEGPDSSPLTIRLQGYENIRAVAQFPGFSPSVENRLNQLYGDAGVAKSDPVENLFGGGDIVIDSHGRSIVVGTKTDSANVSIVVARFLPTGLPDPDFGSNGVTESADLNFESISEYSYVAVNSADDIIVAAVSADSTFVCVKFLGVDGSQVTTGFGTSGVAQSTVITNLQTVGGYVAIDTLDRILVGGYTSDFQLVVARFATDGSLDTDGFGTSGIATIEIPYLLGGGYVTTDAYDNVYVGGATLANTMVVAKLTSGGILEASYSNPTGFGTNGIAETPAISGLLGGGSVALDQFETVIVGGYTSNQTFVAVKFLSSGSVDSLFGTNGIAYTNPIGVDIHLFGDIAVDSNNSIVIGGITAQYVLSIPVGLGKFVVARWLQNGDIDVTFSSTGFALSQTIAGLTQGGFVGTDVFDHILVGGFGPQYIYSGSNGILRVAEFLSGEEIFVNNPGGLSPADYKIFWYGNNPDMFKDFLAVEFYARVITDQTAREATLLAVLNILNNYATVYQNQPGWNLIWHLYKKYADFNHAKDILIVAYPSSSDEITSFFTEFEGRIGALTGKFPAAG